MCKKAEGNNYNIQINQGKGGITIASNNGQVTINQNKEVSSVANEEASESDDASSGDQSKQKEWPNPEESTIANIWETKDGTRCLSTITKGEYDGKVAFPLDDKRKATKQMQLMMLLCEKYPQGVSLSEIIREIYPDDLKKLMENHEHAHSLLRRICTLISDVRTKKLRPSGINPNIISSLGMDISVDDTVTLLVKHLNDKDKKKEEKFHKENTT